MKVEAVFMHRGKKAGQKQDEDEGLNTRIHDVPHRIFKSAGFDGGGVKSCCHSKEHVALKEKKAG